MFSKSYQLLPQRDPAGPKTPGLFVDADGFTQPGYHGGVSFDSMPNVSRHDFTGMQCLITLTRVKRWQNTRQSIWPYVYLTRTILHLSRSSTRTRKFHFSEEFFFFFSLLSA